MRYIILASLLGWVSSASAQVADLGYDLRIDIPVLTLAAGWGIAAEIARPALAAESCRWCDRSLNPVDSAVRDALRWRNTSTPDLLSSVIGYGVVPAAALGLLVFSESHDDALSNIWIDLLAVAEAVTLSSGLTQVVKFSAARERPFARVLPAAEKPDTAQPSNNNTSFFSGHTNLAFSLAVAAGTVATLRHYRWAPWVWVAGLVFATATGYLRIASDAHYFTDVVTGAFTGATLGFFVPYLLHRPLSRSGVSLHVNAVPGGAFASVSWFSFH